MLKQAGRHFRGWVFRFAAVMALMFASHFVATANAQRTGAQVRGPSADAHGRALPLSVTCGGGTNEWTGTAGDNRWTTATNWSSGAVPVSTDNVCIASTFTTAITIGTLGTTNQTIASLDSGAPLAITAGPLTITGTATFAADLTLSGTLTLNGTSSMTTLEQGSGTLGGSSTLTVSGVLTWSGGTESGTGTTNANGGMTLTVEPFLSGRTLNNTKVATWNGSAFLMENG
ncbi:MAG: hypothetical protein WA718_12180, partial [Terriglobales bacterium]